MKFVDHGDNVYTVVGGSFPYCNTLVILKEELTLVDPGCPIEDLRAFLRSHGLELRDVKTIILSHIHPDHITHAVRLNRLSRCRIAANDITAPLFDRKEKMKQFLGFEQNHSVRPHWEALVNDKMYGALDEGTIDEVLHDGDRFALGSLVVKTVYTPGHTADHMCVEVEGTRRLLFAADIDCTSFGPYYGHPTSSIDDFRESIERVRSGSYDALISGHLNNPEVVDFRSALAEYDRQFDVREEKVLASILAGARSIDDIVMSPIIYPSLSNIVYLQFEKWMIEKHVESLVRRGLVERQGQTLASAWR